MADVKYPQVKVSLAGMDGNAFTILGNVGMAMRRAGVPGIEINAFRNEAMSGDYNHLLRTVMLTVDTSGDDEDDSYDEDPDHWSEWDEDGED